MQEQHFSPLLRAPFLRPQYPVRRLHISSLRIICLADEGERSVSVAGSWGRMVVGGEGIDLAGAAEGRGET